MGKQLWLVFTICFTTVCQATHLCGGEITYTCLAKDSFEIQVTLYRDCRGVPMPTLSMMVQALNCSFSKNLTLAKKTCVDVTPVCAKSCSKCDPNNCNKDGIGGGSNPGCSFPHGYEKQVYAARIGLGNNNCDYFRLWFTYTSGRGNISTCCSGGNFHIESYLRKSAQNNSAKFVENPTLIVAANACQSLSFAASDPDGDSLSYHLVPALDYIAVSSYYNSGYTYLVPLNFDSFPNTIPKGGKCAGFVLDSITGLLFFKPTKQQVAVIAAEVRESPNDTSGRPVVIGRVMRDMLVVVLGATAATPPFFAAQSHLSFCGKDSVSFRVNVLDSGTADTVSVRVSSGFKNLTYQVSGGKNKAVDFGFKADSTWPPGVSRQIHLAASDDGCPLTSRKFEAITLTRQDTVKGQIKVLSVQNCLTLSLAFSGISTANTLSVKSWKIFDSAMATYSGSTCTHTFTKPGKYLVGVETDYGCANWFYDTVLAGWDNVSPDFLGADINGCSAPVVLSAPVINGSVVYWSNATHAQTAKIYSSGTFWCRISTKTGCLVYDTIQVNIFQPRKPVIASQTLCRYDTAWLDAGGGFASWKWNTGEPTRQIATNLPGLYTCTTTDSNGCTASGIANVIIDPAQKLRLPAAIAMCSGGVALLDAGKGYHRYAWSTSDTTQAIAATQPGNYAVTVFNGVGCSDSGKVAVSFYAVHDAAFTVSAIADSFRFSPVYQRAGNYFWQFGDGITSSLKNPAHRFSIQGQYSVSLSVKDSNDCPAASSQTLTYTGLSSAPGPVLTIFPNPGTGIFTIMSPGGYSFRLADMAGKLLQSGQLTPGHNTLTIHHGRGCYLLQAGSSHFRIFVL